jgi:hypothetical protein
MNQAPKEKSLAANEARSQREMTAPTIVATNLPDDLLKCGACKENDHSRHAVNTFSGASPQGAA